jgi:hypothetical protein
MKDPFFEENQAFSETETTLAFQAYRKVAKCPPENVAYVFHLALTERNISIENCHRIAQLLRNEETNRLNRLRSRTTPNKGKSYNRGAYYSLNEESLDYLSNKTQGNSKNGTLMNNVDPIEDHEPPKLSTQDQEWLEIHRLKKLGRHRYYKKVATHYELFKDKGAIAAKYKTSPQNVDNEFLKLRDIHKL